MPEVASYPTLAALDDGHVFYVEAPDSQNVEASTVRDYMRGPTAPTPTGTTAADTIALQAFLDATTSGDTVHFGNHLWTVDDTVALPAHRHYVGTMFRNAVGSGFKMANGANLDAVVASEEWFSASATPTSALPIHFSHFYIDGNKSNNPSGGGHGFVSMNFQSQIEFVVAQSCLGDGIRCTGETLAGNGITNTANEIKIYRCQSRSCDGRGIYVHENDATATLTDGWIENCIVSTTLENGIQIDGAAGWFLGGNHTYGTEKSGYFIGHAFRTRLIGNYAESFGDSATAASYAGINLFSSGMNGNGPNQIVGNIVSASDAPASGTTLRGIAVRTASSQVGYVSIVGNGCYGRTHTTATTGITCINQDGTASTVATIAGNTVVGWDAPYSVSSSATGTTTIAFAGNSGQNVLAATSFSATPTISPSTVDAAGGQWQMTMTANVTAQTFADGMDGQIMNLCYIQDATGSRTVAWPANMINPPTVTATALAATNVTVQYRAALDQWHCIAAR